MGPPTSKEQAAIPKQIKFFLNIKPSGRIDFSIENGKVALRSIKTSKDLRGSLTARGNGAIHAEPRQAKAVVGLGV